MRPIGFMREVFRTSFGWLLAVWMFVMTWLFMKAALAQDAAAAVEPAVEGIDWSSMIEQLLPPVVIAIIGVLSAFAIWLKSPTAQAIRQKVKNETAGSALAWLSGVVFDYVGHASQVLVEGLRQDYADGKITEAEYKARLATVKDAMLKDLLDAALGRLQASGAVPAGLAGIDVARGIIDRKIETALPAVKAARQDPPLPSAAG